MLLYLKYLIQIILSPSNGWEDVRTSNPSEGWMLRRGFLPLLIVSALSEFLGLCYNKGYTFDILLIKALIDFGSYYLALFIGRVIMEMYVSRLVVCDDRAEIKKRGEIFLLLGLGEMLVMQIIFNIFQADITLLRFLPIYNVLIIYKAADFMRVSADKLMLFTLVASVAVVVVPLVIYNLMNAIIL